MKMTGAQRKAQILEAGAKLAAKNGAANVTRRMVAEQCECAEGLVSVYMGDSATAQKAYARKAKAMGLALPDKAKSDAIGVKMRSHGPRDKRDTRKRSVREVEAIKRKRLGKVGAAKKSAAVDVSRVSAVRTASATTVAVKRGNQIVRPETVLGKKAVAKLRETKPKPARESKPLVSPKRALPSPGEAPAPPERKSAARKPKAYPVNDGSPLPMPPNLVGSLP